MRLYDILQIANRTFGSMNILIGHVLMRVSLFLRVLSGARRFLTRDSLAIYHTYRILQIRHQKRRLTCQK